MTEGSKILASIQQEVADEVKSHVTHDDSSYCSESACSNQCGNNCSEHSDAGGD